MTDNKNLIDALSILMTIPSLNLDEPDKHKHVFIQAGAAALSDGDEGKAVRDKLLETMGNTLNGRVKVLAVEALGSVLEKTFDPAIQQEIITRMVEYSSTSTTQPVKKALSDFAIRFPDLWFGGLVSVFADAAQKKDSPNLFNAVNERVWNEVGARKLQETWPSRSP